MAEEEKKAPLPPQMQQELTGQAPVQDFDVTIFEPASEEVQLPSRGIYYNEKNSVLKKSEGKILIRPMTFKEETMMTNPRLVKTGQLLTALLKSVIKTPGINVDWLLSTDRMFLFYYLRSISYGDEYRFNFPCSNCGANIDTVVKLGQLNVTYAPSDNKEPMEVDLPVSKKKIYMRYSRGIDENIESTTVSNNPNAPKEEVTIIDGFLRLVQDIKDIPRTNWRLFLESLSVKDSAKLRNAFEGKESGLDTNISIECHSCNNVEKIDLPLTANFFRTD